MFQHIPRTTLLYLATVGLGLSAHAVDTQEESTILQPATVGAGCHFGEWISASSNWLAVSADANDDESHDNRVYLFRRHNGPYQLMETIESSDLSIGGLCLNGTRLFVPTLNSVLVYERQGVNNWQLNHELTDDPDSPSLVSTIASDGETLVILHSGSLSVHARDDDTDQWVKQLGIDEDDFEDITFSTTIAVNGDWFAVGGLSGDESGAWDFVYMFYRTPAGWAHTQTLSNDDDNFGTTLVMEGDRLAVGGSDPGISIYQLDGSWSWSESFTEPVDGLALSEHWLISGDVALAPTGTDYLGGASATQKIGDLWTDEIALVGSDCLDTGNPLDASLLGNAAAIAGDWVFLGAPWHGGDETGAVYVYEVDTGPPVYCLGDVNEDLQVDIEDLLGAIEEWGQDCLLFDCNADVDDDDEVGIDDLLGIINNWGPCVD